MVKVYTYSIGNFNTLRCLEQIRNDICYHDCDVTVVSVGAGFSYGQLGISHFATEDLAIFRAIPNIMVVAPSIMGGTIAYGSNVKIHRSKIPSIGQRFCWA